MYPEKFSVIRLVENEPVPDRAIIMWNDIVTLIKVFQSKAPSKQPKDNKFCDNLVKYHLNPLIPVNLHLFRDVATRLNVFLVKLQTSSLMVPFLCEEIASILKWTIRFFVQRSTLKKADMPYKFQKLGVNKRGNVMLERYIKLTKSAKEVLKKVLTNLHQGLKDL